jgi:hypothetical protein
MAFHLEYHRLAVANIYHADAFSGATVDLQACGGQLLEMNLAVPFRLKAQ